MRCDQCGREGTRGFETFGGGKHVEFYYDGKTLPMKVPEVTQCTGRVACRRRQWRSLQLSARARLLRDDY